MAEQVDAKDLKSFGINFPHGFDSRHRYHVAAVFVLFATAFYFK